MIENVNVDRETNNIIPFYVRNLEQIIEPK